MSNIIRSILKCSLMTTLMFVVCSLLMGMGGCHEHCDRAPTAQERAKCRKESRARIMKRYNCKNDGDCDSNEYCDSQTPGTKKLCTKKLIGGMYKRMDAVIKAKGARTKY